MIVVSYSLRRAAPCMSIQSWPCGTNDRARLWLSVWRTQLREPRLRNGVSQTDKNETDLPVRQGKLRPAGGRARLRCSAESLSASRSVGDAVSVPYFGKQTASPTGIGNEIYTCSIDGVSSSSSSVSPDSSSSTSGAGATAGKSFCFNVS